jgi:hypothetical protein
MAAAVVAPVVRNDCRDNDNDDNDTRWCCNPRWGPLLLTLVLVVDVVVERLGGGGGCRALTAAEQQEATMTNKTVQEQQYNSETRFG